MKVLQTPGGRRADELERSHYLSSLLLSYSGPTPAQVSPQDREVLEVVAVDHHTRVAVHAVLDQRALGVNHVEQLLSVDLTEGSRRRCKCEPATIVLF